MSFCLQSSRQIPGRLSWAWEPRFTPHPRALPCMYKIRISNILIYILSKEDYRPIYVVYSICNANSITLARAFSYFSSSLLIMPHYYISFQLSTWSLQPNSSDCRINLFTDLLTMYVLPSPFFVPFPSLDTTMSNLTLEILHPRKPIHILRSTYV